LLAARAAWYRPAVLVGPGAGVGVRWRLSPGGANVGCELGRDGVPPACVSNPLGGYRRERMPAGGEVPQLASDMGGERGRVRVIAEGACAGGDGGVDGVGEGAAEEPSGQIEEPGGEVRVRDWRHPAGERAEHG